MPNVSAEQKRRTLAVLEKAIEVGSPIQVGRLWGIGEEIARRHEIEEHNRMREQREEAG